MTSTSISFRAQIQTLQKQISALKHPDPTEVDIAVDRIARSILQTPMSSEERRLLLAELLQVRVGLIDHIPVNGLKDSCLFLNLIQNIPPSPLCPAYNKMRFPSISNYHQIGWNISCVRLDLKGLGLVPKIVLDNIGPLEGKQIDLLSTTVDGRFFHFNRSLNHSSHSWAHQHAIPGPEKIQGPNQTETQNYDANSSCDVEMGLFPEVGYETAYEAGAIAINHLSPMNVHVHAPGNLKNVKSNDMLYSPDNAHFCAIQGTPFGIDWSAMKKDNQVAITKRVVLFDYTHPICIALLDSIHHCSGLKKHLHQLSAVSEAIEQTFALVIEGFKNNKPYAMEAFHQLPLAFQYGIYREAWILFGSLNEIHGDFGKASFNNQNSLEGKFHCSNAMRSDCVRSFSTRLESLLVESQIAILQSQSLVKGDNILALMKCAQLFKKDGHAGLEAFNSTLTEQEKEAVRLAFWELSGCPRISDFGSTRFPLNYNQPEAIHLKVQSILLAASRQTHRFTNPIVEIPLQASNSSAEQPPAPSYPMNSSTKPPVESFSVAEKKEPELNEKPAQASVKKLPLEELIDLAFDHEFSILEAPTRAARVNQLLSNLEEKTRNRIYERIYHNSQNPLKGGGTWGELHVADDLNLLMNVIQEEFI